MIKSENSFENVMTRLSLEQLDTYLFRFKGKNAGIQRIYGGTNEIMKELIARSIDN